MIVVNHLTIPTGDMSQQVTRLQTCDCEKVTIVANHLKNLAEDTQNMNKSKINLDL